MLFRTGCHSKKGAFTLAKENAAALDKGDMTQGSIMKKILLFSLPILGGSIFTQLYNVVDSLVVGNYIGADALAAVGSSFAISMVCNSIFAGLGLGSSVICSQLYGAGEKKELSKTVNTTFFLALIIGGILTIVGMLISRPILELLNTPENIIDSATIYLRIVFLGSIGHLFYNMGAAVLRGLGDSKWPMYFLIICAILNVILDLIFVIALDMGCAGVAWATIIAQFISAIGVVFRIARGGYHVTVNKDTLRLDGKKALMIAKIGIPSAVTMLVSSAGMLVIQSFSNSFGSNFVATMTVTMKIDGFALLPLQALGTAITTFVGQNLGADREDRVKEGVRKTSLLIVAVGLVMGVIMFFFGYQLVGAFTKEQEVREIGKVAMRIICVIYWAMGLQQAFSGIMRGAGAVTIPMIISIVCMLVRIPVAYLTAVVPGNYRGMFYSMVVSTMLGTLFLFLYYKFGNWKKHVSVRKAEEAPAPESAE